MARRKRRRSGISTYFRQVFTEHPEWLNEKSNDPILAKYRADKGLPPDADVDRRIKSGLANLKSNLRKMGRGKGRARAVAAATAARSNKLEALEEMIDDCLTLAKTLDRVALENIIHLLRKARNQVVWKIGE